MKKTVSVTIKTNKQISNDNDLNHFFQTDPEKVSIIVDLDQNKPSSTSNGKKLPKSAIVGIVVGLIVIIAIVIVLIIVFIKKKRKNMNLSEIENSESSGSLRL